MNFKAYNACPLEFDEYCNFDCEHNFQVIIPVVRKRNKYSVILSLKRYLSAIPSK